MLSIQDSRRARSVGIDWWPCTADSTSTRWAGQRVDCIVSCCTYLPRPGLVKSRKLSRRSQFIRILEYSYVWNALPLESGISKWTSQIILREKWVTDRSRKYWGTARIGTADPGTQTSVCSARSWLPVHPLAKLMHIAYQNYRQRFADNLSL